MMMVSISSRSLSTWRIGSRSVTFSCSVRWSFCRRSRIHCSSSPSSSRKVDSCISESRSTPTCDSSRRTGRDVRIELTRIRLRGNASINSSQALSRSVCEYGLHRPLPAALPSVASSVAAAVSFGRLMLNTGIFSVDLMPGAGMCVAGRDACTWGCGAAGACGAACGVAPVACGDVALCVAAGADGFVGAVAAAALTSGALVSAASIFLSRPSPSLPLLGEGLSDWHILASVSSTRNCLLVAVR